MEREVLNRDIPIGTWPPAIVMKSDIEGHDMVMLSHLFAAGSLCKISFIYGEHMTAEWTSAISLILQVANCTTHIQVLGDESGDDSLLQMNDTIYGT